MSDKKPDILEKLIQLHEQGIFRKHESFIGKCRIDPEQFMLVQTVHRAGAACRFVLESLFFGAFVKSLFTKIKISILMPE